MIMGDLQSWIPRANEVLGPPPPPPPISIPTNPHPADIAKDSWHAAEEATRDVIASIQPTVVSEKRRQEVVEYVQSLFKSFLGSEVFPFGSVPLKTYLPDGDIDLTALAVPNSEDSMANDVRSVLELEEQNKHAEFEVKDVQYINAEVKLVKCLVQNIVVDISFNQIGGLCTLCFLEQIDRLIGKDHLFKRSIILIKAWCYHESRILGAHHALISTYALETLVLYIFHLFHSSLDGPLAVLYRFLDYYSKFDWDNYFISLYGPIRVSSLPELVADAPENEGGDLLLTKEYLRNCADLFSVPPRGNESNSRTFPLKHLNIVDPLKENNNLGRSVSRANFYRIRSAFTYGAKKLGRILLSPSNRIACEVNMFFKNTLDRHRSGERPDVGDALHNEVDFAPSDLKATDRGGKMCEEINAIKVKLSAMNLLASEENTRCPVGDSRDLTSRPSGCGQSREKNKASVSANEKNWAQSGKDFYPLQYYFRPKNGQAAAANLAVGPTLSSTRALPSHEEVRLVQPDSSEPESSTSSTSWLSNHWSLPLSWNADLLQNSHPSDWSLAGATESGGSECADPNKLSDLSGDFDLHTSNLRYAQCGRDYLMGNLFLPVGHHSSSHQYQNKHSWDPAWQHGAYANMNGNVLSHGQPYSPVSYQTAQPYIGSAYGVEDLRKPRGTGTYFPNTAYRGNYKERHSPGKGKNPAHANNLSRQRSSGRAETFQDASFQEKSCLEPPEQSQLPVTHGTNHGKMAALNPAHSVRPPPLKENNACGFVFSREGRLEFGSFRPVPLSGAPSTAQTHGSGQMSAPSAGIKPSMSSNQERSSKAYQLKDEGDFPPLSG